MPLPAGAAGTVAARFQTNSTSLPSVPSMPSTPSVPGVPAGPARPCIAACNAATACAAVPQRLVIVGASAGVSVVVSFHAGVRRSEEHTSELQSLMRISYAVFCLKKKKNKKNQANTNEQQSIQDTYT